MKKTGYYTFYSVLTFLFSPIITLYLRYRLAKGKEDKARFRERLGHPSKKRPAGKLIWIHCASVGESFSVLPLINEIKENILITSGTVTSANILKNRLPDNVIHQYVPVDRLGGVKRFLNHWKPDLAIWVESELWPHLILNCKCPMILLNGRMSEESYNKWQKMRSFINLLLSRFKIIFPQSKNEKFRELGAENVKYIGNIKYAAPPLEYDEGELEKLKKEIGDRKVFLVVSTHEGEEIFIKLALTAIKKEFDDILIIIVPRHPERAGEIKKVFPDAVLRSQSESVFLSKEEMVEDKDEAQKLARDTSIELSTVPDVLKDDSEPDNVYIADTMGELGLFYKLCDVALIGGSLVPHGGHNPLEAAKLNCAVIYGEFVDNFKEIYDELGESAIQVLDETSLSDTVVKLLKDEEYRKKITKEAYDKAMSKMDILDEIKKEIERLL